jgi:Uma2 family endonuclease
MEHHAWDTGIKLEYVNGLPVWEGSPVFRHQKKIDDIRRSIRSDDKLTSPCDCVSVADLTIHFPDGSIKRPDISIFCTEPLELDTICTEIPAVVIEIISKGYEKKDTEVGLPFYLVQGLPDIVIFDPATNSLTHYHAGKSDTHQSPIELTFACGCRATF